MTAEERAVIDALVEAWNRFVDLPNEHGDDTDEFRRLIHSAQEKVLSRPTRRQMNVATPNQPKA